jgi:DNA-binding HxlR family transcriptional regulator
MNFSWQTVIFAGAGKTPGEEIHYMIKHLFALMDGNKRFNELQRQVTGISAKVLSNELKDMEMNGFIRKVPGSDAKQVTAYELCDYSHTLGDVLDALSQWGAMHRKKITGRTVETAAPL